MFRLHVFCLAIFRLHVSAPCFSIFSMSVKRETANPSVQQHQYKHCIEDWLARVQRVAIDDVVPYPIDDLTAVTPASMMALFGLLDKLIEVGCVNGMVFPVKFESACRDIVVRNRLRHHSEHASDQYINKFTDHVKTHFNMLRYMVRETKKVVYGYCYRYASMAK